MFKTIGTLINVYPISSGLIFISIGLVLLFFQLKKKQSSKMSDNGIIEWKLLVQTWGTIIMFGLIGVIIILKSL